ncbi:MAG: S-layer homology domain-containing protein [Lawsonibacter sp.]
MRKKALSVFLVLSMVIAMLPVVSVPVGATAESWNYAAFDIDGNTSGDQYFSGGSGTGDAPYEIGSAQELANLSYLINNGVPGYCENTVYYKLTADITLNPGTFASDGTYTSAGSESAAEWTAIGCFETNCSFRGSFHGNGHTVSGIYINKTGISLSDSTQGLFGTLESGTIQNVGIVNSYILGYMYAGGITGRNYSGTIQGCYNAGFVRAVQGAGGIVGIGNAGAAVTKCFNIGAITGMGYPNSQISGIVGQNALTISYCYNAGSITGCESVAGIAGSNAYCGAVQYSFNSGSISGDSLGSSYIGSIAGRDLPSTVSSCYYDKQMCACLGIGGSTADTVGVAEGTLTHDMTGENLRAGLGVVDNWTFTAGLYPRLSGYIDASADYGMDEPDAAYVSAAPVFLYDNSGTSATDYETCANVTRDFALGIPNNVSWTSGDTDTVSIAADDGVICGSNGGGVILTAALGGVSKTVRLASITHYCSVTYGANGSSGTLPTQSDVEEGGFFTIAPSSGLAKTDYTFDYWRSGTGRYGAASIYNNIRTDVVFTAIWKADAPSSAPTLAGKTDSTITVTAVSGQEYSIDDGLTWQSSNTFTGLNTNTVYSISSRVAASGSDLASDPGPALSVTTNSRSGGSSSRTITVTQTSSFLFDGAQGAVKAEANMTRAFSSSVEVKVTDTDESASGFGLGIGNTVYPFDISLYIKGTNIKTEPRDGYAVTISLPVPDDLLDGKEQLSVAHKADDGSVTTLASELKQINGVWHLVFEATDFSPYALVANSTGTYDKTAGLPYYMDSEGNEVFIGFTANGKYIAPDGVTVRFKENAKTFTDTGSHWAKDYIGFVTEREIFLGTGSNAFSPDSVMTRAMFATVIGRLYERSYGELEAMSTHAFTDCDYKDYYGKYVDWAAENGIVGGYGNGKFGPGDPVTREQMAAILYHFAEFLGALPNDMDTELSYPDADSISSYAKNAALYCQSTGIITGRDGGSFVPQGTATRAEVAVVLERLIEHRLD